MSKFTHKDNKTFIYRQLWHTCGRIAFEKPASSADFSPVDRITLSIFSAGMISQSDLLASRLFFDAVPLQHQSDALQLFLIMMASSLSQGNVMFPAKENEMLIACTQTIDRAAQILAASDQPYITAYETALILPEFIHQFILHAQSGDYAVIIGDAGKPILEYQDFWYYQKYYTATTTLTTLLKNRLACSMLAIDELRTQQALHKIIGNSNLHNTQKVAVALACLNRTIIITGGPGVGKTTVVTQILRTLLELHPDINATKDIVICAPTGRAAARLKESIAGTMAQAGELNAQESVLQNMSGHTVHRMLGYSPRTGMFSHSHLDPIEARIVVIDEVSMLDIATFRSVLDALASTAILILLGDTNQLPSIEAGAVLGDIAAAFGSQHPNDPDAPVPTLSEQTAKALSRLLENPVDQRLISTQSHPLQDKLIVLTKSFRSELGIAQCAHLINTQKNASAENAGSCLYQATANIFNTSANILDTSNFAFSHNIMQIRDSDIPAIAEKWVDAFWGSSYIAQVKLITALIEKNLQSTSKEIPLSAKLLSAAQDAIISTALNNLFAYLTKSIILCIVRNGEYGSETINELLGSILTQKLEPNIHTKLFSGCPALVTRNMYSLGLWNGDRGIILRIENRLFFAIQRESSKKGIAHFIPADDIAGLEISGALTVHKSQGGEFDKVLLMFPEHKNHPLLTKEILYTALTRAKSGVAIAGSSEAFDAAVYHKTVRRSGLIF